MGLEKAKSLLEVKDGKTFLDLIADQIKYTREQIGAKVGLRLATALVLRRRRKAIVVWLRQTRCCQDRRRLATTQ